MNIILQTALRNAQPIGCFFARTTRRNQIVPSAFEASRVLGHARASKHNASLWRVDGPPSPALVTARPSVSDRKDERGVVGSVHRLPPLPARDFLGFRPAKSRIGQLDAVGGHDLDKRGGTRGALTDRQPSGFAWQATRTEGVSGSEPLKV